MTKQTKRHKFADAIIAMAEGKQVQFRMPREGVDQWTDFTGDIEHANFSRYGIQWRVKPDAKKYRVALMKSDNMDINSYPCMTDTEITANNWEKSKGFVRWLTDWVVYEV